MARRVVAAVVAAVLVLAGCGGDGGDGDSSATTTSPTSTTTTSEAVEEVPAYQVDLEALGADDMGGRDNQSPGSARTQEYIVGRLAQFAEPLVPGFRQPFAAGTNLLGVIRGSDRPDEYLILGAHYDHLGENCRTSDDADTICNGATDNAAGVAVVLELGRRLAAGDHPRRSVVLAFWDAEEDGLLGSAAYVADPAVPLDATVVYLNWDNQGSNLLPSLRGVTFLIGAETGGAPLADAVRAAASTSDLDPLPLSLLFGQGRSDHAVFAAASVPTVFSSDATGGCYHTAQDDLAAVDVDKLGREIDLGELLARELAGTDTPPVFTAGTPAATFEDARSLRDVVDRAEADLDLLPVAQRALVDQRIGDLRAVVDSGAAAFDDAAVGTVLGSAVDLVDALTAMECDAFLEE